ncbi:MAG: DUF2786 domain-containing protein [Planctomycetes bacterium]|nr:DUF2786 domain-containing protein [Planctomycetota bacterium]
MIADPQDMPEYDLARIPPRLQAAWVEQLLHFWYQYNHLYVEGRLRRPLFRLGASRTKLGSWERASRTITISACHILSHPWEDVMETLRHEMAHQYVDEILLADDASPHGEPFARACHLLRCDASARTRSTAVGTIESSRDERDKMLTRVKELLALAGSPNENEAATAMRLAQKYLLKYNLSLAEVKAPREYGVRFLGPCAARIQEYQYTLGRILQEHFFVLSIWTFSYDPVGDRPGRILQVSGTPENLEIAEYIHAYVMRVAASLWEAYRRANPRGGTKFQYLAGVLSGLEDKLDRQRKQLREEHALVWVGDRGLDAYYRHINPRIRRVGGSGVSRNDEYFAGRKEGRRIQIRRPLGGESKARGRLLSGPGE